jgi:hypothetical protein
MIAYFVFNMILVVLLLRVLVFCEFRICYYNTSFGGVQLKSGFAQFHLLRYVKDLYLVLGLLLIQVQHLNSSGLKCFHLG